jgi:hypothetical protein
MKLTNIEKNKIAKLDTMTAAYKAVYKEARRGRRSALRHCAAVPERQTPGARRHLSLADAATFSYRSRWPSERA